MHCALGLSLWTLLFALSWAPLSSSALSSGDATYQVLPADVLALRTNLAIFDVGFSEDLWVKKGFGHCPNVSCLVSSDEDLCDYTDPRNCNDTVRSPYCDSESLLCSMDFLILRPDEPITFQLDAGRNQIFAYFYNGSADSCLFYYFRVTAEYGDPDVRIYTAWDYNNNGTVFEFGDKYGPEDVIMCPTDDLFGTMVIEVIAFESSYAAVGNGGKFTAWLTRKPLPPAPLAPPPCRLPPNLPDKDEAGRPLTYRCLSDGEHATVLNQKTTAYEHFALELPPGCTQFYFDTDSNVFISWKTALPPTNRSKEGMDLNIVSADDIGRDNGVFSVCRNETPTGFIFFAVKIQRHDRYSDSFLFVDSSDRWTFLDKIGDMNFYEAQFSLLQSTRLECPQAAFLCNFQINDLKHLDQAPYDCFRYFPFASTLNFSNPFFPRPPLYAPSAIRLPSLTTVYSTLGVAKFNNIYAAPPSPLNPRKFTAALVLDLQVDRMKPLYSLFPERDVPSCTMVFQGGLTDKTGEPFYKRVEFRQKDRDCDFDRFVGVMSRLFDLETKLSDLAGQQLANARYALDVAAIHPTITACHNLVQAEYTTTPVNFSATTSLCVLPISDPRWDTDPCCNMSVGWASAGCKPREVMFDRQTAVDKIQASNCTQSRCASLQIQDYASIMRNILNPIHGCSASIDDPWEFELRIWQPYINCRDHWFGVDQILGRPCLVDSDCEGYGWCDLLRGSCYYPIDNATAQFLECLLPQLDGYVAHELELAFQIPPSLDRANETYIQNVMDALYSPDCTGVYSLGFPARRHFWRTESSEVQRDECSEDFCPEVNCLDRHCTPPLGCLARFVYCFQSYFRIEPTEAGQPYCVEYSYQCNWLLPDFSQPKTEPDCLQNQNLHFCGFCEPDDSENACLEYQNVDEATCEMSFICIHGSGLYSFTTKPEECEQTAACTYNCYDPTSGEDVPCQSKQQCEESGGFCENEEFLNPSGNCLSPLAPYLYPPCTYPTMEGCVEPDILDQQNCSSRGFKWVMPARTKEDCLGRGQGCSETIYDFAFTNNRITTLKGSSDCLDVHGKPVPLVNWINGKWINYRAKPLQWITRKWRPVTNYAPTFPFFHFDLFMANTIDKKYAFQIRSDAQCRYHGIGAVLASVVCDCARSGIRTEACYQPNLLSQLHILSQSNDTEAQLSISSTAIATICPGPQNPIQAPPATIYPLQNSIIGFDCLTVYINNPTAISYKDKEPRLSSYLLAFEQNTQWQIRNHLGALIGQVVGDGLELNFEGRISSIKICLGLRPDIEPMDPENYVVPDFAFTSGIANTTIALLPMEVHVETADANQFCAKFSPVSGIKYYPIKRMEQFSNVQRNSFSNPEMAVYISAVIIYGIAAVLAWARVGMAYYRFGCRKALGMQTHNVFIIWGLLSLVRCIYMILVVSGYIIDHNTATIDYILIELPGFLLFTTMTYFVVLWAIAYYASARQKNITAQMAKILIVINVLLYSAFILLIVLYEILQNQKYVICGGLSNILDFNSRKSLAVAYRVIIAMVALAIAVSFFIYGSRLYLELKKLGYEKNKKTNLLFYMTAVCSVSMVLQCIFMLTVAIIDLDSNIVALCVLMAVEVLPIVTCFILTVRSTRTTKSPSEVETPLIPSETLPSDTPSTNENF